ncbi:hypothetical protein SNE40_013190 [Patella caerulea]|uniref:Uncharacterized protein n=1 Tax=Patella caerulea TaxID=87958 RepID=A0AAN8PWN5_PATCE
MLILLSLKQFQRKPESINDLLKLSFKELSTKINNYGYLTEIQKQVTGKKQHVTGRNWQASSFFNSSFLFLSVMMPLSAAEKQRRYRQRRDADPERRARYLQNEKDKYIKDKETGKKKQVKDMSKREHRLKKKEWRQYKKDFKARRIHSWCEAD